MKLKLSLLCGFLINCVFGISLTSKPALTPALQLLQLADRYYQAQNYETSLTEYWRFLCFHADHPYAFYAWYKAGMANKHLENWEAARQLFRQALRYDIATTYREKIRYQLALTYFAQSDWDLAQLELFKLSRQDTVGTVSNTAHLFYALALIYKNDWLAASEAISNASASFPQQEEILLRLRQVEQHLNHLNQFSPRKSPQLAKWLSTFIPGSGQIYAGKWWAGTNAFCLNLGTSYWLLDTLLAGHYRDGLLIFLFVWERYYRGNRLHAEEAAIQANQEDRQVIVQKIFAWFNEITQFMPATSCLIRWEELPELP